MSGGLGHRGLLTEGCASGAARRRVTAGRTDSDATEEECEQEEAAHAAPRSRFYAFIKACLLMSVFLLAVEVAAYLIALEALRNVDVHSGATSCRLTLSEDETPRPRALRIRIEDDGVGIPGDAQPGVGLLSMRERAAELGGSLHLGPGRLGGTTVEAVLPLPTPARG